MNISQPIRKAGTALLNFFSQPNVVKTMAPRIASEAALSAAAQQIVPRLLGGQPGMSLPMNLLHAGTEAAVRIPISSSMISKGVPEAFAGTTASILSNAAASAVASRFANPIDPEIAQENHPDFQQLYAMQQMNADAKAAEHNMKLQEIYARNYNPPSFVYHKSSRDPAATATDIATAALRSSQFG
jgi:hypothetical protein